MNWLFCMKYPYIIDFDIVISFLLFFKTFINYLSWKCPITLSSPFSCNSICFYVEMVFLELVYLKNYITHSTRLL